MKKRREYKKYTVVVNAKAIELLMDCVTYVYPELVVDDNVSERDLDNLRNKLYRSLLEICKREKRLK